MNRNSTIEEPPPQWNSKPMYHLPPWAEPLIVLSILCGAMFLTRRRNYPIFRKRKDNLYDTYLDSESSTSIDDLLMHDSKTEADSQNDIKTTKHPLKRRICFRLHLHTPNSSRFANHIHSRILQKLPFLIEMFYWIITYLFYRLANIFAEKIFTSSMIDVAQAHGLAILEFEQFSWAKFLFPWKERDVQQWFMKNHQTALTVLNRAYALIHIPGTVGFIAWYYYIAPSRSTFAAIRRTLTLTNLFAFLTFTFYPCMPPRLLPAEYGFLDSVRHDNATSIWMSGKYVNSLAAMPSMHFAYAFVIGCTVVYHSGVFRNDVEKGESKKGVLGRLLYCSFGLGYPAMVLMTIIATANHYWMDALVASVVACAAYFFNEICLILLPVEDLLLWVLRVEKPVPSTGGRLGQR